MSPKAIVNFFHPTDAWLTRRVVLIGLFVVIALFYVLTLPVNHSEAIDGYDYAYKAETVPLFEVEDTRSILYTFVNKLLYQASEVLGLGLRSFSVLIAFEVLAGAASVLLMARLLYRGFGLTPVASWSGAAFLGLSYGFWRYVGEVEVYVPSACLVLATLTLLFDALADDRQRWQSVIPAAVLAGLAGLYYQPNVIPLFLAIPALMLSRKHFSSFIAYGAIGSAVILCGIIIAYLLDNGLPLTPASLVAFATSRSEEFPNYSVNLKTFAAMVQAILNNIVSTNWLFGVDAITHGLQNLYPDRSVAPKTYAAEHFRPFVYLAIPLLALLLGFLAWISLLAVRNRQRWYFDHRILFCIAWFAIQFVIVGYLDPTSREPWVMSVPPLVILFAVYVFDPVARMEKGNALALFLCTLLLYNFFGGMGMIQSRAGNFQEARTAWLRANASPKDAVLFGEQENDRRMKRYLLYVDGLQIFTYPPVKEVAPNEDAAQTAFLDNLFKKLQVQNGRLFVLGEFFAGDWKFHGDHWKNEDSVARARSFMERIRRNAHMVDQGPLGSIFEVKREDR